MNFETRQYVINLLTEWDEDLIEVFDRVEPTKWVDAAEELKQILSNHVDNLLAAAKEAYGYFD